MDDRAYGALIERGIVTAVIGGKYTVASLDRSGIVTPPLDAINEEAYTINDLVTYFMFRDGTGMILSAGDGSGPGPSGLGTVSENTTEGWGTMPTYVPQNGEFCIYSDTHELKIGDGLAYIADLPFVGHGEATAVSIALAAHAGNMSVHVSQEERDCWNNKVDVGVAGEQLVFTRS